MESRQVMDEFKFTAIAVVAVCVDEIDEGCDVGQNIHLVFTAADAEFTMQCFGIPLVCRDIRHQHDIGGRAQVNRRLFNSFQQMHNGFITASFFFRRFFFLCTFFQILQKNRSNMGAFRAKGACAVGVKDEAKGFIDADIDMIAASAHGDIGFNIDQTGCLIAGYSQIFDCTLFTECFCLMKDWFTACPFDVFQCEHMPWPPYPSCYFSMEQA